MADPKDKGSAKEPAQDVQQPTSVDAASIGDDTEEWVFTIVSATGEIAKVEKHEKASGQRSELSQDEYAALVGYIDPSAAQYGQDAGGYGYDQSAYGYGGGYESGATGYEGVEVYQAGYYQALQDYETALVQQQYEAAAAQQQYEAAAAQQQYEAAAAMAAYGGYTAEEHAAYLQGMADYEALLS